MRPRFLAVLILLVAMSGTASAQKRAFTIEDLYHVKGISDVHVSPDGKSVVYLLTESDLARGKRFGHIWMMDADGSNTRQLTYGAKGESSPRFSPDGKSLLMVSSRDGAPSLYLIPVNGGEARRLTTISTGVSDPLWSPNSKWIAFSTDVYPQCADDDPCNQKTHDTWTNGPLKAHVADSLLYRHWTDWKDGTRTHIFLANAETGEVRDLTPGDFDSPTFQLGGPLQYDFSPDSSEIVFVSNHDKTPASSTNNDLWLLSLTDRQAKPRNITVSNPAYDGSPKYSPDGKFIGYRIQTLPGYESDLFRIALYERSAGTSTVLTESFKNWVEDFKWSPDSRSIFFTGPVEGQNPIFRLELESKSITPLLADKTIDEFEFTVDARRMIYARRSTDEPAEIFSIEISDGKASTPRRLTNVNATVASEVDIRPAETMWVDGAGASKIQVFIVKPHGFDAGRKYPLILNVHGGPQSRWADAFRGDWQVYPGAGYVVAFANPHGSTGYGQEFTAEISGDYGGAVFDDLMKVTDALEKLPYVDRARMGAMGWSFGGYMMDWFEGHTDRFKAIASMMGLYDLRSFYGATEELWFPEWDLKGQPWTSDLYEKWSPSNSVKNFKTPALVLSGERDYRVPYSQSLQFFTALQKMNVPSKLLVYANAGHWPSWYEMALYYTAHLEWFSKYLGGEAPPWTTEQFLRNNVFDTQTGKRQTER
jgi:dipeptidyl aminopeptidase/acylaminoacyl peptidase